MSNSRDEFVSKGASFAKEVINEQVNYEISLTYDSQLAEIIKSNEHILGDSIRTNNDIPKTIRSKIEEYSVELKSVIEATAAHIEHNKFASVEQAVEGFRAGIAQKRSLQDILKAERKISLSFESVNIATEIFCILNEKLRDEIKKISPSQDKQKYSDLMLKNAILVYELTGFLINYLKNHNLSGVDDIQKVKQDVEEKIRTIEMNNKIVEEKAGDQARDSELAKSALSEVQKNRQIAELCRKKWASFDKKIDDLRDGIETLKSVIPDLELQQLIAKGRLLSLELVMVINSFEANISLINKVADVKKFALEPFTVDDARLLLGLSPEQEF